jgi:prolyl 4-hydroxylase
MGTFFSKYSNDPIIDKLSKKISRLTGFPIANEEELQVLHYELGGEYRPHFDSFNPETEARKYLLNGGQRIATCMVYLNTPEGGGETIFPEVNVTIMPEKGKAVLFYNVEPTGQIDPLSLHGGTPVLAGEKWLITCWLRADAIR